MNTYALQLIKHFEGKVLTPYQCPGGYWTVGWGHRLMKHEPIKPITHEEAEALLKQDIACSERILAKLIEVPLQEHQAASLISFIFNVGPAAFQRSTLRMKVNREEHEDIAPEFNKWVWSRGKKLPGLVRRRLIEAELYSGSIAQFFYVRSDR